MPRPSRAPLPQHERCSPTEDHENTQENDGSRAHVERMPRPSSQRLARSSPTMISVDPVRLARRQLEIDRERIEAEGRRWGRPRRVDGPTRARALAMRAEGRSVRAIAVALKVPRATIARALASVTTHRG
jgi:hypothetical protein